MSPSGGVETAQKGRSHRDGFLWGSGNLLSIKFQNAGRGPSGQVSYGLLPVTAAPRGEGRLGAHGAALAAADPEAPPPFINDASQHISSNTQSPIMLLRQIKQ